jgi:hypothetical protein
MSSAHATGDGTAPIAASASAVHAPMDGGVGLGNAKSVAADPDDDADNEDARRRAKIDVIAGAFKIALSQIKNDYEPSDHVLAEGLASFLRKRANSALVDDAFGAMADEGFSFDLYAGQPDDEGSLGLDEELFDLLAKIYAGRRMRRTDNEPALIDDLMHEFEGSRAFHNHF